MVGYHTPILFLVFNRPAVTARVFESIRAQRPHRLFVAADGPRPERDGDAALCAETRRLATAVDWPCEVTTLFRENNLGCGNAVSTAIGWFFSLVEEGIILEDDCLPHPDFFRFCATMLERYRNDGRVALVTGDHFIPASLACTHSHYFSKYAQIWGWATWRRTWETYDRHLTSLPVAGWDAIVRRLSPTMIEREYWLDVLRSLLAGNIDTWDYQLIFSLWKTGGLTVAPHRNLICNLGYGPDATHTSFDGTLAEQPTGPLSLALGDQPPVVADPALDEFTFFVRFLERFTQTWWIEQALSPGKKLGEARVELGRKERYIRELENEIRDKRRQLRLATDALARMQAT
jgi:hypothetical protein